MWELQTFWELRMLWTMWELQELEELREILSNIWPITGISCIIDRSYVHE